MAGVWHLYGLCTAHVWLAYGRCMYKKSIDVDPVPDLIPRSGHAIGVVVGVWIRDRPLISDARIVW